MMRLLMAMAMSAPDRSLATLLSYCISCYWMSKCAFFDWLMVFGCHKTCYYNVIKAVFIYQNGNYFIQNIVVYYSWHRVLHFSCVCVCIIFSALSFATALRRILLAQQLFTAILFIFHLTFCIFARRLTTRWIACFSLCQFKTENIEQQPAPAPAPTTNDLIFSFQTPSAYENPGILSTENIHGYFDTKSNIKWIASFFTPSVSLSLCLRVCVCVLCEAYDGFDMMGNHIQNWKI